MVPSESAKAFAILGLRRFATARTDGSSRLHSHPTARLGRTYQFPVRHDALAAAAEKDTSDSHHISVGRGANLATLRIPQALVPLLVVGNCRRPDQERGNRNCYAE